MCFLGAWSCSDYQRGFQSRWQSSRVLLAWVVVSESTEMDAIEVGTSCNLFCNAITMIASRCGEFERRSRAAA